MKRNKILIGIDPAYRKNGFHIAILDTDNELSFKRFSHPSDFLVWFLYEINHSEIKVCIENSEEQKKAVFTNHKNSFKASTIGKGAGMNIATSSIAYHFMAHFMQPEKDLISVSPKEKGKAIPMILINKILKTEKITWLRQKGERQAWNEDKRVCFTLIYKFLLT